LTELLLQFGLPARHSHSAICAITSPNSSKAADQTSAEVKLANWKSQYGISKIPAARHRGAQGSEKPADENAGHAPALHKGLAARQQVRIARQRPHLRDVFLVFEAEPVGDPVAKGSSNAARDPDRPEADAAGADQGADRDQRPPGRDQQRDEGERFSECQYEHDGGGPDLMVAHEISQSARKIFHF
jgi:hypothetical protein